jgi:UrcA family protein
MLKVIAKYAPAVAVLGALTIGSLCVNAQDAERAAAKPSVTVRYADLNLNTSAGLDALYARLRSAARGVCNVGEGRALVDAMAAKSCYRQTLDTAVDNMKSPPLSALHRAETARG